MKEKTIKKDPTGSKIKNIIIVILVTIIVGLAGYIIYTDFILKTTTNVNNQEEKLEQEKSDEEQLKITDDVKSQLKSILGIIEEEADFFPRDFYNIMLKSTGVINEFSIDKKRTIVIDYAIMNGIYTKVSGAEYNWCESGKGYCEGISLEHYKKSSSKFGITNGYEEIFTGDFQKYNNLYLVGTGGYVSTGKIKHNLTYESTKTDIRVIDNYTYTPDEGIAEEATKTYTFKKNGADYYLYSIN